MNIRYLIISLKQTIYFFVRKKKYDFVIYSPSYFVIEGTFAVGYEINQKKNYRYKYKPP